ncbi:hypothetical protein RRG08_040105 [Elysia crispata]|uniref:Uncharacterized protein n=1 Tax=Elysia crispata TaxID=231223 RepID=A0AAE0XVW0_9GAST|nr:hypothetical protein RRG08_040105 [Elysia crispata]
MEHGGKGSTAYTINVVYHRSLIQANSLDRAEFINNLIKLSHLVSTSPICLDREATQWSQTAVLGQGNSDQLTSRGLDTTKEDLSVSFSSSKSFIK